MTRLTSQSTFALDPLHSDTVRPAGGGVKDVPFFPYAPYIPQTEMSVSGASFSQKHVQLPPVEEEDEQEEAQERVEDNERVRSPSVSPILVTPLISCASTAV